MSKKQGMPGFGCGRKDCKVCGDNGILEAIMMDMDSTLLGAIIGGGGHSDVFTNAFKGKSSLDKEGLTEFLTGGSVSGLKKLLAKLMEGIDTSSLQPEIDETLPEFVRDAWKVVCRITDGKSFAQFNREQMMLSLSVSIQQGISYDREKKVAALEVSGTMPKVVKEIGNEKIAKLIKKIVLATVAAGKTEREEDELSLSLRIAKAQWDNHQGFIIDTLCQNWPALFDIDNSLSIERAPGDSPEGSSYVLVLDGKIQKNEVVPEYIGARVICLQEENEKLESKIHEQEKELKMLTQKVRAEKANIMRDTDLVVEYFEEHPIDDCEPVLMAIDPKDDMPCLVVVASVDENLTEIPKAILKDIALTHISGKRILPDDFIKALGAEELIAKLKETMDAV